MSELYTVFLHPPKHPDSTITMDVFHTISISTEESELLKANGIGCPPQESCGSYPCCHTPCLDPDYLGDRYDMIFKPKHHINVWWLLHNTEARNTIPDNEHEVYEMKFARCQRLKDKRLQIRREIDCYKLRRLGLDESFLDPDDYEPCLEADEVPSEQPELLRSSGNVE